MCVFIKLHITAQSGLVILVILCHIDPPKGGSMILATKTCVCFFPFILDIKFVERTSRGYTEFFFHLLSAVRALIFLARRIQPFLSLVDRKVEFCVLTIYLFSTRWAFFFFFFFLLRRKIPFAGIELMSQRVRFRGYL